MGLRPVGLGLLASLILFSRAGAFVIVFEAGSGESSIAPSQSSHAFNTRSFLPARQSSALTRPRTSSAFQPLIHPLSWLEQQLEALDALKQATLENLVIQRLEAQQQQQMEPQQLEAEMLHRVGCHRMAPAMHEYSQASLVSEPQLVFSEPQFDGPQELDEFSDLSDLNADARSDVVDLLSSASYEDERMDASSSTSSTSSSTSSASYGVERPAQLERSDWITLDDRMAGSSSSRGSSSSSGLVQGALAQHMLRGAAIGWLDVVELEVVQEQVPGPQWVQDADLELQMEILLQQDQDYKLMSAADLHASALRTRIKQDLIMLQTFLQSVLPFSPRNTATATFLLPNREPNLNLDHGHFDEEDFVASLAPSSSSSAVSADYSDQLSGRAISPPPSPYLLLDLDGDGYPDLELALVGSDGQVNWRLLLLGALLLGTLVMAVGFVRSLVQLRAAMGACGGAGRVLVPVMFERDGEMVQGLMLLDDGEEGGMGTGKGAWGMQGKGGWTMQAEGKGDGAKEAGHEEEVAQGVVVAAEVAAEPKV